jgi:hypothetical protein
MSWSLSDAPHVTVSPTPAAPATEVGVTVSATGVAPEGETPAATETHFGLIRAAPEVAFAMHRIRNVGVPVGMAGGMTKSNSNVESAAIDAAT